MANSIQARYRNHGCAFAKKTAGFRPDGFRFTEKPAPVAGFFVANRDERNESLACEAELSQRWTSVSRSASDGMGQRLLVDVSAFPQFARLGRLNPAY